MVAALEKPKVTDKPNESVVLQIDDSDRYITTVESQILTLEDWLEIPLQSTEWVNGKLQEKNEVTIKHSRIQANLSYFWRLRITQSNLGGIVYTEAPYRTSYQEKERGRKPDVAYLTPELLEQFGQPSSFPQSFPLIAELISPTDYMEEAIAKTQEYLCSGFEEVWLVLPEAKWVIIITSETKQIFTAINKVSTQKVLVGFNMPVSELLD